MLVLTRKIGESLRIGDNIVIKVSKVNGSAVSVAIDAPRSVRIIRTEIDNDPHGVLFQSPALELPR